MIDKICQLKAAESTPLSAKPRWLAWGLAVVMLPLAVAAVVMHRMIGRVMQEAGDPALAATLRELQAWQAAVGGASFVLALAAVACAMRRPERPAPTVAERETPAMPQPAACGHMRELEELVARRTAQLEDANAQMAGQVEQLQGLLRAVSHDLAAPARNIDGMAKLLLMKQRDKLDADAIEKLQRISANVKKQTAMINELVVRHRGQAADHKQARPSDCIEVRSVIEDVVQTLRHEIDEKHIAVRVVGSFPAIKAERRRVEQVFQNLIDNAVKYMGQSRLRRITIRGEADLHFYRFAVEDTGPGIPWEHQGRLFDAYTRTQQAQASDVSGKGVGLSLVKQIAREHGGQVWVDSEPGKGATFHFTFAREVVSLPAAA